MLWLNSAVPADFETRRSHRPRKPKRKRLVKRWWFWAIIIVLLLLIAAVVWVGVRTMSAKSSLESAVSKATALEGNLKSLDVKSLSTEYPSLHKDTSHAVDMTSDWIYKAAERVPFVGPNLLAFKQTAILTNDVVEEGVHPIADATKDLSLDSFKPVNGKINIAPIQQLTPAMTKAAAAISLADTASKKIDTKGTIRALSSKVTQLQELLGKANSVMTDAGKILPLVAPALGADGPRHYLMIFQGNSEVRAEGGNPAAMALLEVNDGKISITKQLSSADFHNARATSVTPLDPAVEHIYSDIIGRWIPNVTSTPDFATTAALVTGYFSEVDGTKLDGVVSFDPVALGYLLAATGPVSLPTGQQLTGANAASLLLNKAYYLYPLGPESDAFFAAAASASFQALTSGSGSPGAMLAALTKAADEGRLLFWSANVAEEKTIADTRLSGILPATNTDSTVMGAYFNDVTGSKMDYYVKASVAVSSTQCTADKPTFAEDVTLSNTIDPSIIPGLPYYITGGYFQPGTISTDVIVYGPVGASITSWKGSVASTLVSTGMIGGRPVSRINVVLAPGQSVTFNYAMSGAKGTYGPLEAQTTPMVWPTPTKVTTPGCRAGE